MNFNPEPYNLMEGLQHWGVVFGVGLAIVLTVTLVVSFVLNGSRGFDRFLQQSGRLLGEMLRTSPRRVWALSLLTFRESMRRKVLLVGVVFALLFMFAGWFLSDTQTRPELQAKRHISFVLTTISFLVLPLMLLLACWGLPEDVKARSLHTVVTKPARRHEVYLGRVFGFTLIGTLILVVMGAVGYVWTVRQVPPEAHSSLICRVPVYGRLSFLDSRGRKQFRGVNVGDIWDFRSYIAGGTPQRAVWEFDKVTPADLVTLKDPDTGEVLRDEDNRPRQGLRLETNFEVFRTYKGNQALGVRCEVRLVRLHRTETIRALAPPGLAGFEALRRNLEGGRFGEAAVALEKIVNRLTSGTQSLSRPDFRRIAGGYADFGRLLNSFADKDEKNAAWIREAAAAANQCATAAENEDAAALVDGLKQLARHFRTQEAALRKMLVDLVARVKSFEVKEYREPVTINVERSLLLRINNRGELVQGDLFRDLIHGGRLTVQVSCLDPEQYLGMARPDLFIRRPDRHFAVGFTKAIFGTWLMMVLVVLLSVTGSCFLKGPVATLLTFVFLVLGSAFHGFLEKVVTGQLDSAGAFESVYRLVNHLNPRVKIGDIRGKEAIETVDQSLIGVLKLVYWIIPDFENYRVTPYLANGFDVPWDSSLLPAVVTTLGYFIPCLLLGYLSLASRELEEK